MAPSRSSVMPCPTLVLASVGLAAPLPSTFIPQCYAIRRRAAFFPICFQRLAHAALVFARAGTVFAISLSSATDIASPTEANLLSSSRRNTMKTLIIKDLSIATELDAKAMAAVQGGMGKYAPLFSLNKDEFKFSAEQVIGQQQSTEVNNGINAAFVSDITANVKPKQDAHNTINLF
jgi:hypothetical protein